MSLLLAFAAALPRPALPLIRRPSWAAFSRAELAGVSTILVVGAALRLFNLSGLPSGIHGDEGEFGLAAASILANHGPHPFGVAFLGDPALYLYVLAPFIALFGQNIVAVRLPSAIAGFATLAAFYLLMRRMFGVRPALLAAALLAGSATHVGFSRLALNVIFVPLFACLTVYALLEAQQSRRPVWWLASGILGGLAVYTHFGGRIVPLVVGLYCFYLLAVHRAQWRSWVGGTLLSFVGGAMALAPLIAHLWGQTNQLTEHMTGRLIFGAWDRATAAQNTTSVLGVVMGQIKTNLVAFLAGSDAGPFYAFADSPLLSELLGPLFVLGIAFLIIKIKDARHAAALIWFWTVVLVGGAITLDSPQFHRLLQATLPAFMGMALLMDWIIDLGARAGGRALGAGVVVLSTIAILVGGYADEVNFFRRAPEPWADGTGQAVFVQQTNKQALADGKRIPKYYNLAVPFLYWGYGVNRFLNAGTPGTDMINASNELPIVDNDGRDVVFLIWPINRHYLATIKQYYPGGEQGDFMYGTGQYARPVFTYYRVSSEEIEDRRSVQASYRSGDGDPLLRIEHAFGSSSDPPARLSYPAEATWSGQLFTPRFGPYRFRVDGADEVGLSIDGQQIIASKDEDAEIVLARGLHQVELVATLANRASQAKLFWGQGGGAVSAIDPGYLWNGPGRGLVATVGPADAGPLTPDPPATGRPVFMSRVDGFLGFRDAGNAIGGRASTATWTGTLVAPQSGAYGFDVNSNSDCIISIDGRPVVTSLDVRENQKDVAAGVQLDAGLHAIQVKYRWTGGIGFLEVFWTLPNGEREILGPNQLAIDEDRAAAIATQVQSVSPVPAPSSGGGGGVGVAGATPPVSAGPSYEGTDLSRPLGIGVDAEGNVYVGDRGHQRVAVYSPDLQLLRGWSVPPPSGSPPEGSAPPEIGDVAVAPDGSIVVVDSKNQRVSVFDSAGSLTKISNGSSLFLASPNGAAFGPDGSLWVADTAHNEIAHVLPPLKPTLDGSQRLKPGDQITQPIEQPLDVVVDPTRPDRVFVVDMRGRIFQMGLDGKISAQWALPVSTLEGGSRLAMSPDGTTIYMTDPERKRIAVLRPASEALSYIDGATIGVDDPSAVAVSSDGRLFVLDRVGRIRVVAPADIVASAPGGR